MKRLADSFGAAGLVAVMLLIVGPAQIYVANPNDFSFAFRDILPMLTAAAVLVSVLGAVALALLPERVGRVLLALGCVLALLLWVQGNFLPWSFGPLDGRPIDWRAQPVRALAESAVWVSALVLGGVAAKAVLQQRRWIIGGLLAVNVSYAAFLMVPLFGRQHADSYYVDEQDKFTFSAQRNVILLVLDTFQSDVFQELVNERPEIPETFGGFTYYRNAISGFPFTLTSMPLMLTGRYYENGRQYKDFVREAFTGESVPGVLKANGFQADLFPHSLGYLESYESIASNITRHMPARARARHAATLADLALFRYAPRATKRFIHGEGKWVTSQWFVQSDGHPDVEFFASVGRAGRVEPGPGRFKLFHLDGLHAPIEFDEHLTPGTFPVDRPHYKHQAAAFTKLLRTFFDDLKRLGVYDNSLILIVGDHGTTGYGLDVNVAASGRQEGFHAGHTVPHGRSIIESSLPLVLVKPPGANGPFTVSDAPVSHEDLPKTMVQGAGVAAFAHLTSLGDWSEHAERRRRFLSYSWVADSESRPGFPPMDEFWVTGFSWLRSSWHPSFRRFTDSVVMDPRPIPFFEFPVNLRFAAGEVATQFLGLGWAPPDKEFTWATGTRAAMLVPVGLGGATLRLRTTLTPLTTAGHAGQRVRARVEGRRIREWVARGPAAFDVILADDAPPEGELTLEFQLPDAVTPEALGLSGDRRRLSVALNEVQLLSVPDYQLGNVVTFGAGGDSAPWEEYGWSSPEAGFTWTDGSEAAVVLPLKAASPLRLDVSLTPFVQAPRRPAQRILVRANDHLIATWTAGAGGSYTATIPASALRGAVLRLTFQFPDAISPEDLLGARDARKLGAAVATLRVSTLPQ